MWHFAAKHFLITSPLKKKTEFVFSQEDAARSEERSGGLIPREGSLFLAQYPGILIPNCAVRNTGRWLEMV